MYLYDRILHKIRDDEMGGTYIMHGIDYKYMQHFGKKKKLNWVRVAQDRTGFGEHGNEALGPIKDQQSNY
jgi:hypothetical protein